MKNSIVYLNINIIFGEQLKTNRNYENSSKFYQKH